MRWAQAGLKVVIGSRKAERAEQAAEEIRELAGGDVTGRDNAGCAAESDIVLAGLPWEAHEETLASLRAELAGKIVVDCVNPLGFDSKGPYALSVPEGSAAQQAERPAQPDEAGGEEVARDGLRREEPLRQPIFRHVGDARRDRVRNAPQLQGAAVQPHLAAVAGPHAEEGEGQLRAAGAEQAGEAHDLARHQA